MQPRRVRTSTGERVAKQVYTLALLAQRQLSAEELKNFLSGSFSLLEEDILGENK